MQDRYKYKAYHKPTKTLFDVYGFNEDFVFADTLDGVGTQFNPARMDDCELIQCTGLKDKNGKLIYEGDIVNIWHKDERLCEENAQIFWSNNRGGFVFNYHTSYGHITECSIDKMIVEVIGNIYGNKELLKEFKNVK